MEEERRTESGVEQNSMNTGIFKLRYHHGGKLLRAPTVRYINGSEVEYDEDVDCICYWTIIGAIKHLGYDTRMAVNVYYVEEGKSLNGGLKLISDDKEVLEMANQLRNTKVVDIYVEHLNEKVSGTELPDALRQSVKDAEQFVNLVDDTCQLPRTPPTPILDDSDVETKGDGNENESESREDLPELKEVLTDFSTGKRFESRLAKNDKGPLSLQKHVSLETQNTKAMEEGIDAELILSIGREVEVASNEKGLRGAWSACTIVKLPKNKTEGKFLVQCKHLLKDDNRTPLTETVELSCIRPLPPKPEIPGDQCFQINEVVDVFHLDVWSTGSVSQVLDNPRRYIVSFADPPEELAFSSSSLRPHWQWVNGKWVKPSKFKEGSSSDSQGLVEQSCDTAKDAQATIQIERSDSVRSDIKMHNVFCVTSRKDEMHQPMASKEPEMKKAKRGTPEGDASALQPSKRFKHASVGSCKKFGTMRKFNAEGSKHQDGEKMYNLKVAAATEVSEVQKVTEEFESSITRGVSAECTSGSMTEGSSHVSKEEMKLHKEDGMGRDQKIDGLVEIEEPQSDCPRKTINIAGESGRNLHENEEQSQSICYKKDSVCLTGDYELEEGQDLPFIRSLPIWKEIESMEIFKAMPQTPHFHPLLKSKEFLCEGLAVGHMLNFASLVQKTSKLTVADPRDPFITLLDVIPEFEILGFDVKAVRDRTSNLLSMNDRHGNLQHQLKESELQVKKRSDELTKINEELDANYKMVRELKEKQALLLSRKEGKESQLSTLKVSLDVSTEELQNVKADFESLVPGNWSSW